jgi:sugar phosphate isomerase/epimerase
MDASLARGHASRMKTIALVFASLATATVAMAQQEPVTVSATATTTVRLAARNDRAAEQLGWQLGVQAWTFRDRTTFEAIDTARALGLKYIELYPGQKMAVDGDAKVGADMTPEQLAALQKHLAAAGVRAMAFGVVGFNKDEAAARKTFAFAKAMGIGTITCEPDTDAWDLVEKLACEYQIQIACHDHPKPSHYWNPETVLASVKGRSQRLGACADTGHWPRSGLDTVASLKLLEGRIRSMHFKDIAPANAKGEDKPWGTGEGKAHEMLTELHRQGFRGLISVEYETGAGKELEANVAKCIEFFDAQAREFVAAEKGEK